MCQGFGNFQKTYKKIIVSGDIIEIYEYEKQPFLGNISEIDDYDPLDLENTDIPKKDRVIERREQTVRDARNRVRRLALANFGSNDKFITLTYRKNMRDIEQADNDFKKFIMRFKYRFGISDLKYIAVREFQKRGAIHYHLICNWDKLFTSENEIKEFERLLGQKVWGHGFVDIKTIDYVDNVGAYIIKYMTKNVSINFFKNKKIYLSSKGLEQPKEYTYAEAEAIINAYDLGQKKSVFSNHYETEYQGVCTYTEYNLKRQHN